MPCGIRNGIWPPAQTIKAILSCFASKPLKYKGRVATRPAFPPQCDQLVSTGSATRWMENPKEKTPPMDDGALKCFAGLRRQSRLTQAAIFLHYSKYQHNAFHVSPTVRSFPEPKSELSPRALCPKGISERPTASRRAEGQRRHRTPIASCALRRPAPVRAVNGWGRAVGHRYQAPALYGDETALAQRR